MLWTGPRIWADGALWDELPNVVMPIVRGLLGAVPTGLGFMHGAARGLDAYIDRICALDLLSSVTPEVYPIMPGEHPFDRDRRMIENKPGMTIGVPHRLSETGGTWHTLRLSHDAGIPTFVCREVLGYGWRFERYIPRVSAAGIKAAQEGLW